MDFGGSGKGRRDLFSRISNTTMKTARHPSILGRTHLGSPSSSFSTSFTNPLRFSFRVPSRSNLIIVGYTINQMADRGHNPRPAIRSYCHKLVQDFDQNRE